MTVRVLVVDDSPTARKLLVHIVNSAADMEVVGEAGDGAQAVRLNQKLKPGVILMDITMPKMNGMEATEEIMANDPTPIVMISANLQGREAEIGFKALQIGALTVMPKPVGMGSPDYSDQARKLVNTLRNMAGVRVIRHRGSRKAAPPQAPRPVTLGAKTKPQIAAIVSSTGGPAALGEIIKQLPPEFPIPIVIVQHIAASFNESLMGWLGGLTSLRVLEPRIGQHPEEGHIYLAPGGKHLKLDRNLSFTFSAVPKTSHIPSGDELLNSVADAYGSQAVGMVLTGMGADGARGLRRMYEAGAFTIAQDEASCAVYGMPKEAVAFGGVRKVLPLSDIPNALIQLTLGKEIIR
jgi:two-component system chemotaxis response regulator CheB